MKALVLSSFIQHRDSMAPWKGADMGRLIPQRYPMTMVDTFEPLPDGTAAATLAVRTDNLFAYTDGTLAETALIEHVAQTVQALVAYSALQEEPATRTEAGPPVGLIGEVRHFTCHRRAVAGERLETTVSLGFSFANVMMAKGVTRVGDEVLAETQLKIFLQEHA